MRFVEGKEGRPPEYITGEKDGKAIKEPNPDYDTWVAIDQQVLYFLVNTLSPDILVTTIENGSRGLGGDQGNVFLLVPNAGLKPLHRPRTDEEGQHDNGAIIQQDEGICG
jgi:hypothetical protein